MSTTLIAIYRAAARKLKAATMVTMVVGALNVAAEESAGPEKTRASHGAYVYTELQASIPFHEVAWEKINELIKIQPGFISKTWLAGAGNNSVGGFYAFDSIENAQRFVTGNFPAQARSMGVAQTTRVFDAAATEVASRDMNSVYYDGTLAVKPRAFVYTEVQLHALPFDQTAPWRELNPILRKQPGILAKTWLSGMHTGTPGGFYAFDTLENAKRFAIEYFPTEAAKLNAAFYTRVFDADMTETASRGTRSPFYR